MESKSPKFTPPKVLTNVKKEETLKSLNETYYPVEEIPSGFKAYPKDCKIEYRPYNFGEMLKIGQLNPNGEKFIRLVLDGVRTSFDELDLTFFDYQYLALKRKLVTQGELKTLVSLNCKYCEEPNKYILGIEELGNFEDMQAPDLPICCKMNTASKELVWIPLTIGNYIELIKKDMLGNRLAIYAASVKNMELEEALEYLGAITDDPDIELIREIDSYLGHGLKPFTRSCTKCKKSTSIQLEAGDAVLIPFRESEDTVESRIHFGTQAPLESV